MYKIMMSLLLYDFPAGWTSSRVATDKGPDGQPAVNQNCIQRQVTHTCLTLSPQK